MRTEAFPHFPSLVPPFSRRILRHPAAPFLLSFASWNLVTLGDHLLNHAHPLGNPTPALVNAYNLLAPVTAALLLALTLRKPDPLWWATLPQWGGYEDWLLITLDHLTGRPVPPVFYWLDGTNIALTTVKTLLSQPAITMETVHISLTTFILLSTLLSATTHTILKRRKTQKNTTQKREKAQRKYSIRVEKWKGDSSKPETSKTQP